MAFCTNCGKQIPDDAKVCPECGATLGSQGTSFNAADALNTADCTAQYDAKDIADNKVFGVLAYIGILFLVPLLARKDSPFAKFHTNQGLVLFIFEFISGIVFGLLSCIPFVGWIFSLAGKLISLAFLVFMILGIVYAAQGQAKELPIIGKIKILK